MTLVIRPQHLASSGATLFKFVDRAKPLINASVFMQRGELTSDWRICGFGRRGLVGSRAGGSKQILFRSSIGTRFTCHYNGLAGGFRQLP
jgi:hypothetical protein